MKFSRLCHIGNKVTFPDLKSVYLYFSRVTKGFSDNRVAVLTYRAFLLRLQPVFINYPIQGIGTHKVGRKREFYCCTGMLLRMRQMYREHEYHIVAGGFFHKPQFLNPYSIYVQNTL